MKYNQNVLTRVRMVEQKSGIKYAKQDGKLYKGLKIVYTIIWAASLFMNVLYLSGTFLVYSGTENFKYYQTPLITVSVCTLSLIAGFVLLCLKFNLTAGIISILADIFLILTFGSIMKDDLGFMGLKLSFYLRHFAPLAVMMILICVITIIAVRARVKTKKQYKKVLDNLYNLYNIGNEEGLTDISDQQWDEFLNKYDPTDYTKLFKAQEQSISEEDEEVSSVEK